METKQEVSAGGVIVRKEKKRWEVLIMKDMNNNWTFPKGIIEAGEMPQETAKREIAEEVGLTGLSVRSPLPIIEYWYVRDAIRVHKKVHYFLFDNTENIAPTPQTEEGISEIRWVMLHSAKDLIGYKKTNLMLLQEVENLLATLVNL